MSLMSRIGSELSVALQPLKGHLLPVVILSATLNILMLTGSFFMLLVYDDVLPSRSIPTLIGLMLIAATAYSFLGLIDVIRSRVMIQIGAMVDQQLSERIFDVVSSYELRQGPMRDGTQPVRDLDQVRNYFSGIGPLALLDLPWVLLYLGILFIFHWTLGVITIISVFVLVGLTLYSDRRTRKQMEVLTGLGSARMALAESVRRNADVVRALGMTARFRSSWSEISRSSISETDQLSAFSGRMQSISKVFRMMLQSFILAAGAALVLSGNATGGIIIAGSILSARALAPVEQTIASWKGLVSMTQAWSRLTRVLEVIPENYEPMPLPAPSETLAVENLVSGPPGSKQVTLGGVSFSAEAGKVIAVIGRSGSGKSSLMKAIVGVWPTLRGSIRLDNASIDQWSPDALGEHIGYVPQSIELFSGTVAQNIGRFQPDADPDDILAAAKAADVHDLIVRLPDGYEHHLGVGGGNLSSGQKQRIALARALYRDPFLLVLDEPNSNLDAEGELALAKAIQTAKERGAIVLIVAHRHSILSVVDSIIVMADGRITGMGERNEMLKKLGYSQPAPIADKSSASASN